MVSKEKSKVSNSFLCSPPGRVFPLLAFRVYPLAQIYFFFYLCVRLCLSVCLCSGACGGQEAGAGVTGWCAYLPSVWVLRVEPVPSARATSALNHWAICSPSESFFIFIFCPRVAFWYFPNWMLLELRGSQFGLLAFICERSQSLLFYFIFLSLYSFLPPSLLPFSPYSIPIMLFHFLCPTVLGYAALPFHCFICFSIFEA